MVEADATAATEKLISKFVERKELTCSVPEKGMTAQDSWVWLGPGVQPSFTEQIALAPEGQPVPSRLKITLVGWRGWASHRVEPDGRKGQDRLSDAKGETMAITSSQLQTLLAVMRTGSFAAAAEEVGYSPSNVSQQMLSLEQETGVRLFTRNARSVTPTEAAFGLAKQASRILTGVDAMISSSRAVQDTGREQLRVGIFPSLAARILPLVLRHPDWESSGIDLRVSIAEPWETADELRTGGLDVAFVFQLGESGPSWPPSINRDHVAEDPFRVVIPATWKIAPNTLMTVDELASRPWIMQYPGGSDGIVIEQHLRNHNFRPRVVAVSDDFNATAALVSAGMGGAFLPELSLHHSQGLVRVRVEGLELNRNIIALTSRERPTPRPQALIRLFKEALEGPR